MAILLNEQYWTSCFNCSRKYEATTAEEYQKFSIWEEFWERRKVTNTLGDSEWRATKGNINSLHKIILHQCPHSKKNTLKGEKCQSSLASDNCYSWRLPAPNWREKPMESKPRSVHLKKKSRSRHGWLNSRGDAFLRMRFSTVWEWEIRETQPWGKGLWVWVLPISFSLDDMRMRSETQLWPEDRVITVKYAKTLLSHQVLLAREWFYQCIHHLEGRRFSNSTFSRFFVAPEENQGRNLSSQSIP